MKTNQGCRLFGACEALGGIEGNVVLIHSVVGCHFGMLGFHLTRDMSTTNQACTVVSESDVVFGGEDSLRAALDHVMELYDPAMVTIVTGCVPAIIGDDVQALIDSYDAPVPILAIDGAGFKGPFEQGYEDALAALADLLPDDEPDAWGEDLDAWGEQAGDRVPSINLLGFNQDDYKFDQDLAEFRRMLGGQVALNCVPGRCTVDEIAGLPDAGLTVVLGRGHALARALKERFGVDWVETDYPYGVEGAVRFLTLLEEHLGVDYTDHKREIQQQTLTRIATVFHYLKSLYGRPCAVFGQGARARGLTRFLEEEVGMEVVQIGLFDGPHARERMMEQAERGEAALVFGSSFEGEIADRIGVPLVPYHYPVFDRLALADTPYVGASGALALIEDMLNAVGAARDRRTRLYQRTRLEVAS
ncbi:MAG: nitrogenase component 1 [Propioniciclava sp.]|uniref:nitrogenase component 1 n=1 Tax=Propioniciclava sp. TaxID=2038686 RepID=UPI0039E3D201